MDEKKETSKITKVILNDLQGKKRIVGHDFAANKIKPYKENENSEKPKRPQKTKKRTPLSTPLITIICATSISLIGIGAYSYNKVQDRKKVAEMINQARNIGNKTTNFYKNEARSLNKMIANNKQKTKPHKRKNTS